MERHELGYSGSGQGRCEALVNAVINLRVSYNAANFLTS